MNIEDLKYPVGRFTFPEQVSPQQLENYISTIEKFPSQVREAVDSMTSNQLDTPYRLEGWTIRQVVHHCADSHLNCFIRYKWALTEDNPTIKAYEEDRWATLQDYTLPLEPSLSILEGVHQRWVNLMQHFGDMDWSKTFVHPETKRIMRLDVTTALYDWHCRHHLAHIQLVSR